MNRYRAAVLSAGAGVLLVLSGCGNGPPATPAPAGPPPGTAGKSIGPATVMVQGNDTDQFAPNKSSLKVGDIIQWTNSGSHTHNVTFDDYQPLSGDLGPGDTWEAKFDKPGTYDYHCTFHPAMTATLTVS